MTSFELVILLNFLKNLHRYFILFPPKYIMGDKLHHVIEKSNILHRIMV